MKKITSIILVVVGILIGSFTTYTLLDDKKTDKIEIKVLILPKFEIGEMTGDYPGEAQFYYDAYLKDSDEYDIQGGNDNQKLYVKDGVALYVTGMGKVKSSSSLQAILLDDRFDFSNAYILSTGCGGSSKDYGVMGDVYISTSTVDYDLGHHVDVRDLSEESDTTWFHDESYDSVAVHELNQELCHKIYDLVKDVKLETTENTKTIMAKAFDNASWATRDPEVLLGTSVTSDNYWKGEYDHVNALLIVETYGCVDPFAVTEMEDNALAVVLKQNDLLDHYIVIRDSVNMDVYMNGDTPESLWGTNEYDESLGIAGSNETLDIFETAMKNNYKVGSVVIDAILDGTLE